MKGLVGFVEFQCEEWEEEGLYWRFTSEDGIPLRVFVDGEWA